MAYPKGKRRPPTSGRQKGTPNKITADVRSMILGALDAVGGQQYLQAQARDNPQAFLSLLGKCLPKDLNVQGSGALEVRIIDPTRRDRPAA